MPSSDEKSEKPANFWDSTFALVLLVVAILLARFYIAEPFKIPSGSMEPTLFGHEDYGDRIVTNKLAYVSAGQCALVAAGSLFLIAVGFFASRSYARMRSRVLGGLIFAGTAAGFGLAWGRGAIAGEPQRFDVVVFQYDTFWNRSKYEVQQEKEAEKQHLNMETHTKSQKINYIKRLVGLPGDRILISAGDLWLYDKKDDRYKIVRKWQTDPALQDVLWYPVSLAWTGDVYKDAPQDEREHIAVPWLGAEKGAAGLERNAKSLVLTGDADVSLTYAHPVSNIYLKQGRWPFRHIDCPAAKDEGLKAPSGALFRNPETKSEQMTSYVFHTWEGVQCPNCKQVMFPCVYKPGTPPRIDPLDHFPNGGDVPRFYYGGDHTVGDLRVDVEIDIEKAGTMTLEVGNSLHRAIWTLGAESVPAETANVHPVEQKRALTPGHHKITLAYIDATVLAEIDGTLITRLIDYEIPGSEAGQMQSVAKISFSGVKGTLTRLDLYRDLHWTSMIMDPRPPAEIITGNQSDPPYVRGIDEQGRYYADVPEGHYLMMGDNSPSSSDGRVWGFVPRDNLVGRASFIAWPLSRVRLIR